MKPATLIKRYGMSLIISDFRRKLAHRKGRRQHPNTVHYFHQVDDPYSHLAVQKLDQLKDRYNVRFVNHLVSAPGKAYQGDADRFPGWAVRDARQVAPFYGTELPTVIDTIEEDQVQLANAHLAPLVSRDEFATRAIEIGNRLWCGEKLQDISPVTGATHEGDALREELQHYLGGMFYFEGEWYWGCDRLHHLEQRLIDLGLSSEQGPPCVPRPEPESATGINASGVTLEVFPSLRSPYTAISFGRTLDLVRRSGVKFELKPVMPMMMRGIPAPRAKQLYIMTDCKREADYYGEPFGPIIDPFGEPVKRAFSLLPYMIEQGKDAEFCQAYLKAAWTEAVNITRDAGLRKVVEGIGVDWDKAIATVDNDQWEALLESNVNEMLTGGLWGVPSFRVSGGDEEPFICWGQDRLWRVETEITRRAKAGGNT